MSFTPNTDYLFNHPNTCDICQTAPIKGVMYSCIECEVAFDICGTCHLQGLHRGCKINGHDPLNHSMMEIWSTKHKSTWKKLNKSIPTNVSNPFVPPILSSPPRYHPPPSSFFGPVNPPSIFGPVNIAPPTGGFGFEKPGDGGTRMFSFVKTDGPFNS